MLLRRSRTFSLLLVLLVLLPAAAANAAKPTAPASLRALGASFPVPAAAEPTSLPEALLKSHQALGQLVDGPRSSQAGAAAASGEGTYRVPFAWTDLSGDGLPDFLLFGYDLPDAVALEARRGTDGSFLWQAPTPPGIVWPEPLGDVDGDGIGDILLYSYEYHGTSLCPANVLPWPCTTTYSWTWRLSAYSGLSGEAWWTREYPAHFSYSRSPLGFEYHAENYTFLALPARARGGPALVVDALGFHEKDDEARDGFGVGDLGLAFRVGAAVRSFNGEAAILDARTGEPKASYPSEGSTRRFLFPTQDPSRDATFFLLTLTYPESETSACVDAASVHGCQEGRGAATLAALDGATLEPRWHAQAPQGTVLLGRAPDLDGDGWVDAYAITTSRGAYARAAVSGATGDALWPTAVSGTPLHVGKLAGGAGEDVLFLRRVFDPDTFASSIVATRVEGMTGEVLFQTRTHIPGDESGGGGLGVFALAGDLLGEGAQAWLYEEWSGTPDGGARTFAHLESSLTGETILDLHVEREALVWPTGDLDGDGRADYATFIVDGPWLTTTATSSSTSATLWTRTSVLHQGESVWVASVADARDTGHADLLYLTNTPRAAGWRASATLVDGASGTDAWSMTFG